MLGKVPLLLSNSFEEWQLLMLHSSDPVCEMLELLREHRNDPELADTDLKRWVVPESWFSRFVEDRHVVGCVSDMTVERAKELLQEAFGLPVTINGDRLALHVSSRDNGVIYSVVLDDDEDDE